MRSDLTAANIRKNQDTQGLHESFEPHRQRVMSLIEATVSDLTGQTNNTCSSLVLLGAGNCLDIDLSALCEIFGKIHLVDLDHGALQNAVANVDAPRDKFQIHAPADIAEPLLSLTSRDLHFSEHHTDAFLNVLQHLSSENGIPDVPESDVVVSLCVMSQLFHSLQQIIDENHPAYAQVTQAVRIGHLRRMISMLRQGGVAILVTDIVSSTTAPELESATNESLPDLVKNLVESGNFFTGTNPSTVVNDLNVLSRLDGGPESVHSVDPWLWNMGERTFAVYALRIQKKVPVQVSAR